MTTPKMLLFIVFLTSISSHAQTPDKAKNLIERIAGSKVSIDDPAYLEVKAHVDSGDLKTAATKATQHPGFLNFTVKQMALKMSTRLETMRTPFNDFAASFVGVVRDNRDARQLLTGNFYYRANMANVPSGIAIPNDTVRDLINSNNHYAALDQPEIDIGRILTRIDGQILGPNLAANPDPAGVLTSRSFLSEHAVAGTNRRLVEYTFREMTCTPIEKWSDVNAPDDRVGKDVDRFPGGEFTKFQTSCKGCHTQMDGFRGAFARYDFQGTRVLHSLVEPGASGYLPSGVAEKYNRSGQAGYLYGFTTTDTSWVNNARGLANASHFGWRGTNTVSGNGVASLAQLIANSNRFSQCMVQRVFEAVCRQSFSIEKNAAFVSTMVSAFEAASYNLKNLFVEVAISKECGL